MRYHIKAWVSPEDKRLNPTEPIVHFSVFQNSAVEAQKVLEALHKEDYPNAIVLLHGPHGPEIFHSPPRSR